MEPRIQYVKSSDGVSIAYWKLGEGGTPLLMMPPLGISNLSLEWQFPELRAWYEGLSSERMLVRYDPRGMGMSQREISDYSFEMGVDDLRCVAGQIGERPFDLLALGGFGMWAIRFAVTEPERIRRLVLWSALAEPYGPRMWERLDALLTLAEKDWDLAIEAFAHASLGWSRGREAHAWAAFHKASMKQVDFLRGWQAMRDMPGVVSLLPEVTAPTLILNSESSLVVPRRNARTLATGIPNAQLLNIGPEPPFENEQGTSAVEEFLSDGQSPHAPIPVASEGAGASDTAIILFADIVDSTALTERLGDAAFRDKARELNTSLRGVIRESGGSPIEGPTLGDGLLATFTSARQAIEAALACSTLSNDAGLPLHVGLHAGDVIRESDPDGRSNVYGGAVNIASRISGLSAPGEVLVSDIVRGLARTSAAVTFEDRGEQTLKGVGEPVRVWAVREAE